MSNFYGQYVGFGAAEENLGGGSTFQGKLSGYCHGGQYAGPSGFKRLDKFAFSSTSTSTNIGDLVYVAFSVGGGFSSGLAGFCCGAVSTGYARLNSVQKYDHQTDGDAIDWGDLYATWNHSGDVTDIVNGYGYACGGFANSSFTGAKANFAFASIITSVDIGDLDYFRHGAGGACDGPGGYGYVMGGRISSDAADVTNIDRWAFASGGDSSDVGDLTVSRASRAGLSSATHGYKAGGYKVSGAYRTKFIDKFAWGSSSNATTVGNLVTGVQGNAPASAEAYGFTFGGRYPVYNTRERFSFVTDGNAEDWGDLSLARTGPGGSQV